MELKIPDPFLQKHLEEFQIAMQEYGNDLDSPLAVYRGSVVKAAIQCGWIKEMEIADVGEMTPADVIDISEDIADVVSAVQGLPKN